MNRQHAGPALIAQPPGGVERGRGSAGRRDLLDLPCDACLHVGIGVGVAGVVDENVEPTIGRAREISEPGADGPRIRDVAHERAAGERGAQPGKLLLHGSGRRRPEVVHADARTGAGEGERDLPAEAGTGAGDERDLAVELCHARSSRLGICDTTIASSRAREGP